MSERTSKWVVYVVLAVVLTFVAARMAHTDVGRIFWDSGRSQPGMLARFYYLALLGLSITIVQNIYLRRVLHHLAQRDETPPETP